MSLAFFFHSFFIEQLFVSDLNRFLVLLVVCDIQCLHIWPVYLVLPHHFVPFSLTRMMLQNERTILFNHNILIQIKNKFKPHFQVKFHEFWASVEMRQKQKRSVKTNRNCWSVCQVDNVLWVKRWKSSIDALFIPLPALQACIGHWLCFVGWCARVSHYVGCLWWCGYCALFLTVHCLQFSLFFRSFVSKWCAGIFTCTDIYEKLKLMHHHFIGILFRACKNKHNAILWVSMSYKLYEFAPFFCFVTNAKTCFNYYSKRSMHCCSVMNSWMYHAKKSHDLNKQKQK